MYVSVSINTLWETDLKTDLMDMEKNLTLLQFQVPLTAP